MSREPAVMPGGRVRRIVLGGNEFHIFVSESEIVERFLNQIRVFVAYVMELGGGNAHEENFVGGVAVAGWLQPGVVGVPVDFFLQGVEDAHPGIRDDGGTGERHCLPEYRIRRRKYVREKPKLGIVSSAFIAEQVSFLLSGCRRNVLRDEPDTSTKKSPLRGFARKNSARTLYRIAFFFALSSVEVLTATGSVQLCGQLCARLCMQLCLPLYFCPMKSSGVRASLAPPSCSFRDRPPPTVFRPRRHSRCANLFLRAAPDARCGARATTWGRSGRARSSGAPAPPLPAPRVATRRSASRGSSGSRTRSSRARCPGGAGSRLPATRRTAATRHCAPATEPNPARQTPREFPDAPTRDSAPSADRR